MSPLSKFNRPLTALRAAIEEALPARRRPGRIQLEDRDDFDYENFPTVVAGLSEPGSETMLDAEAIIALADRYAGSWQISEEQQTAFRAALGVHAERNWASLEPLLLQELKRTSYHGGRHFDIFPRLRTSKPLLRQVIDDLGSAVTRHNADAVASLILVTSQEDARSILFALDRLSGGRDADLTVPFVTAIGDGLGWTPWAKLMAIVFGCPSFGNTTFQPTFDATPAGSEKAVAERALAAAILPDQPVRAAAGRLLELDSSMRLSELPPESQAAYVAILADIIGNDAQLRRAVIEALLWLPRYNDRELGQFAALRIIKATDRDWLSTLIGHPNHQVGYAAFALRDAVFGHRADVVTDSPSAPPGLALGLARLGLAGLGAVDGPHTWLGDRMVERLIEQATDTVEREMAAEYEDHCGEGEEALLTIMFERLSARFRQLDDVFAAAARSLGTRHVSLQFRRIDKPEEGARGVRGAKRFATDVCLVVNPVFEGKSLGKRAIIVQAKRLYGDTNRQPIRWDASYRVQLAQMEDLLQQTHSAFHLFQGPLNAGRGLPVIPTLLVRQLAAAHSGTGKYIGVNTVGIASRGFADWLTYDVLALRVGDPFEELVAKAEGSIGRKTRTLLDLPRVELDVSVSGKSKLD